MPFQSLDKNNMAARRAADEALYRIAPYHYLHVLDQNTNVTRLEIGPQTYIRQDNER
jgi:major vault protein